MTRIEKDSLGEKEVPEHAYYGIQTARAVENFPVSGIRESPVLIEAYLQLKKAAALANMELGMLDGERGNAIVRAVDALPSPERVGGIGSAKTLDLDPDLLLHSPNAQGFQLQEHFPIDVFQAGAGTSFNMNVNEVLANRALEILGRKKGDYEFLSPNDHVNMAQSTNDTFPTASHIAVVMAADLLIPILRELVAALRKKAHEFSDIVKSGRTHLMDAMPVTLGAEFGAYAVAMERAIERIAQRRGGLLELPIGGTAIGTGANAHPLYRKTVIEKLSELCNVEFTHARDCFEAIQSRAQLAAFSGSLKELAMELARMANDLRLLNSGPISGLSEITLPAVQPGASIMPGKVNPVMAECLNMVAFQIIGNDAVVSLATQAGQLELNVMTPLMTYNILHSMELLTNYLPTFCSRCIEGIAANEERCSSGMRLNPSLATLLGPKIGYLRAAELAKDALDRGVPVVELAVEKGILTAKEARDIFDRTDIAHCKYEVECPDNEEC